MAKTFADMTPEERPGCVGMWCKSPVVRSDVRFILLTESGVVFFPEALKMGRLELGLIELCDDLPRAWTPGGDPVPMVKEHGFCGSAGKETTVHKYNSGTVYVPSDTPRGEVYRWVGEWEETNE